MRPENKVTLTNLHSLECVFELSKVLMCEFHYDYIENKYGKNSRLLFTDTDSLMYENKTEDVYEDFNNDKEMFGFSNYSNMLKYDNSEKLVVVKIKDEKPRGFSNDKKMFGFSNYSTMSKYYDNSNKLMIGKMKDEKPGVTIDRFFRLKSKMYLYLVNDNSEHKNAKGVNRNVVPTTSHNEYNDILLNKKCLRHSMNRIQSKDNKTGTYELNKIYLFCFHDKIYIQNNGCDGLALGHQVYYKKNSYLTNFKKIFFVEQIVLIFSIVRTAFLSTKLF